MSRYTTTCTRCGKPFHRDRIVYRDDTPEYSIRFCAKCVRDLFPSLISNLTGDDYNWFMTQFSVKSRGTKNRHA